MKRAIGALVVVGLIGGAVWIGVRASNDRYGSIVLTFTLQRCPERGPCEVQSMKPTDHVAALSVDGATAECDRPGDCTFTPGELEEGLAPGTWQIGALPMPGLQRPDSPYIEVERGEVLNVTLQYRSAPETRLVETLDTLPPFGGPETKVGASTNAAVRDYRRSHPDVYAGEFVAQGFLYIGFTKWPRRNVLALQRLAGASNIRAFLAAHSYRELRDIQDRITAEFGLLESEGINVTGIWSDVTSNRVGVMLETLTPEAEVFMRGRYGSDELFFEEGSLAALSSELGS